MSVRRYRLEDGRYMPRNAVKQLSLDVTPPNEEVASFSAVLLFWAATFFTAIGTISTRKPLSFSNHNLFTVARTSFQSFLKRPASIHSVVNCAKRYIILLTPLCNCHSLAVYRFTSVSTRVILLRHIIRPSTVFRRVVTICVEPIKRMLRGRLLTHVRQEIVEPTSTKPSIRDSNASPPVSVVAPVVRVKATLFHRTPGIVLWLIFKVPAMPIVGRFLADSNHISTSKAAKLRIPRRPMFERFFAPLTSTSNHTNNYNVSVNFCKGVAS